MKKCIALLLALTMVFCFAACGEPSSKAEVHSDSTMTAAPIAEQKAEAPQQAVETQNPKQTVETETQAQTEAEESPEPTGPEASEPVQQPTQAQKDTLVIVFSATGTTKRVAELIAGITDADLYEILAAEPYSDADLNWIKMMQIIMK